MLKRYLFVIIILIFIPHFSSASQETRSLSLLSVNNVLKNWDGTVASEATNITDIEGGYSINWLGMVYNISILNGYDTFAYPNGTFVSANIFPHLNRWTTQGTDRWVDIIPSSKYIYRDENNIHLNMTMYEGGFFNITYTVLDNKIKYTWDFYSGTNYNYSIDFQIHGSASTDVSSLTKKYTPGWFNNFTLYDWSDVQSPYLQNVSNTIDTNNKIMYQRIILGQMPTGTRIIIDPSIQLTEDTSDIWADIYVTQAVPDGEYGDATEMKLYECNAGCNERIYLRANISKIPVGATINTGTLWIYEYSTGTTTTASVYHDTKNNYTENTLNWNNQPCPAFCNSTAESTNSSLGTIGWKAFTVTEMLKNASTSGYDNLSMFIKTAETQVKSLPSPAFRTKEYYYNSTTWYIDVNYSIADTTPPASITNLQNTTTYYSINWTWTNPSDSDFNYTMIYINGSFITNTSNVYYLNASLSTSTQYTISTHTVDTSGNINSTWVNQTTWTTDVYYVPPAPISLTNTTGTTWINHSWQTGSGNVTNSYNVSINGKWYNGTTNTYYFNTVGFYNYSSIIVYAFNSSGYASLSSSEVNQTVMTPDLQAPILTNVSGNYFINWSWDINTPDVDEYEIWVYDNTVS